MPHIICITHTIPADTLCDYTYALCICACCVHIYLYTLYTLSTSPVASIIDCHWGNSIWSQTNDVTLFFVETAAQRATGDSGELPPPHLIPALSCALLPTAGPPRPQRAPAVAMEHGHRDPPRYVARYRSPTPSYPQAAAASADPSAARQSSRLPGGGGPPPVCPRQTLVHLPRQPPQHSSPMPPGVGPRNHQ